MSADLTRRTVLTLLGAGAGLALLPRAFAQLRVDITRGRVEPVALAIAPFAYDAPELARLARELPDVVAADLESSGFFRRIDPRAYLQTPDELRGTPRFEDWRRIDAQALVAGLVRLAGSGEIAVEFRLWDVFTGAHLAGFRYVLPRASWRRAAHKIADAVYVRLTGEGGWFDTRIAYVAESGPATRRIKRLAIMDRDGANHRFLTDGRELVMTPRFSPDARRLVYVAWRGGRPAIFERDLESGRERRLGPFPGTAFAPRYAPDGSELLLTVAVRGNSDIYRLPLPGGRLERLTDHPAIDTSPAYDPDAREILFNSDRAGSPQLYLMDRRGGRVRRLSFERGRYGSPVWSPRGDVIAYSVVRGGYFHIGVMRPDGADARPITRSYFDEGPSFAPNGRVLVFTRQDPLRDTKRLMTIDVAGYNLRELPTPLDAVDPDWSPLLP